MQICPTDFWQRCFAIHWRKMPFQQMVLEKLDSHRKESEPWPKPYILHKNLLRVDQRPNVKHKTTKLLEKKKENLWDLALGKEFLDLTPKSQCITRKIDNLDFIKIKNIFSGLRGWKDKLESGEKMCKSYICQRD